MSALEPRAFDQFDRRDRTPAAQGETQMFSNFASGFLSLKVSAAARTPRRTCGALRRALPWLLGVFGFVAALADASAQVGWNGSMQYEPNGFDVAVAASGNTMVLVHNQSTGA
jgi:hypothetical protein